MADRISEETSGEIRTVISERGNICIPLKVNLIGTSERISDRMFESPSKISPGVASFEKFFGEIHEEPLELLLEEFLEKSIKKPLGGNLTVFLSEMLKIKPL